MFSLSSTDFEFVLGTGLGDGSFGLVKTYSNGKFYKYPRISITHGILQSEYLEWKAARINSIFGRSTRVKRVQKKKTVLTGKILRVFNIDSFTPIFFLFTIYFIVAAEKKK